MDHLGPDRVVVKVFKRIEKYFNELAIEFNMNYAESEIVCSLEKLWNSGKLRSFSLDYELNN